MSHSVWVHNLNPYLLQFSETLGIRWYGLSYLIGFVSGGILTALLVRYSFSRDPGARGIAIRPEQIGNFVAACVFGTMVGGRLGYVCFYAPQLLIDFSSQAPYWGVLKIWSGGMASHGGLIGIVIAMLIFGYRQKLSRLHLLDLVTLGGSIGIFFGRIANFVNGELFGREIPIGSSALFAVKFPTEMYLWLQHDSATGPDQLKRMTAAVRAIGVSAESWKSTLSEVATNSVAREKIQALIAQIIGAINSGQVAVHDALAPELPARYASQLIEAALEGALLFVAVVYFWRKPRKPGAVAGFWLIGYSIVRFYGERFRMPDVSLGFRLWGLTRGQWLSIFSLIFAIGLSAYAAARKVRPIGGMMGGMNWRDLNSKLKPANDDKS